MWVIPAIERLADLLRYPCKNAAHGCRVTTLLTEKNGHESACPFRHYNCPFPFCGWIGFQEAILPHLRTTTHSAQLLEGSHHNIDVKLNLLTPFNTDWVISCFDRIFRFTVSYYSFRASNFYSSVCLEDGGSLGDAEFTYTVTAYGKLGRLVSYSRPTHTDVLTRESKFPNDEDCFNIRGVDLKHYVRDEGILRLVIVLGRLETDTSSF